MHNLTGAGAPVLERSVYYDDLSPAAVAKLAARAETLAMSALQAINVEGMALERDDPPRSGERMKIRLGVFFHAEPVRENAGTTSGGTGAPPPAKKPSS